MSAGVPLREAPRTRAAAGASQAPASPHYACLLEVVQAVNSTLQLQSVLNLILDRAIEVMQAGAARAGGARAGTRAERRRSRHGGASRH